MRRLFENSKISLNLSSGDVDMGGYVTLWHGSPLENLESILKNGIVPNKSKVDAEEKVEQAIYEIAEKLKLGGEAVREILKDRELLVSLSIRRLNEAEEDGGVVYVSARKEFAIANALAGREWLEFLVEAALRCKYKRFYEAERRKQFKIHEIQAVLERLTKKRIELCSAGRRGELLKIREQEIELERKAREIEASFYRRWGFMYEVIEETRKLIVGDKAAVFKLRVPKEAFFELLSDRFKEHLPLTPKTVHKLLEIHLKKVDPKYIVAYDIIEKKNRYPDASYKVIKHVELAEV
jgi:hypothetical protein